MPSGAARSTTQSTPNTKSYIPRLKIAQADVPQSLPQAYDKDDDLQDIYLIQRYMEDKVAGFERQGAVA
jgi:hypothetical protein